MFWAPFIWLSLHFGPQAGHSSNGLECGHWSGGAGLLVTGWSSTDVVLEPLDLSLPAGLEEGPQHHTQHHGHHQALGCLSLLLSLAALFCSGPGWPVASPVIHKEVLWPVLPGAESRRPSCHRPGRRSSLLYSLKFCSERHY